MNKDKERVTMGVHVVPGARKNEIVGLKDNVLHVRVSVPPSKGQANKALIDLLSETLHVPVGRIAILRGHTIRNKVLAIEGLTTGQLQDALHQSKPDPGKGRRKEDQNRS